jgi:hypothetical protein
MKRPLGILRSRCACEDVVVACVQATHVFRERNGGAAPQSCRQFAGARIEAEASGTLLLVIVTSAPASASFARQAGRLSSRHVVDTYETRKWKSLHVRRVSRCPNCERSRVVRLKPFLRVRAIIAGCGDVDLLRRFLRWQTPAGFFPLRLNP